MFKKLVGGAACFLRGIFHDLQGEMLFGCRRHNLFFVANNGDCRRNWASIVYDAAKTSSGQAIVFGL